VNELVTNAAKHGATEINVVYEFRGGAHQLSVRDDGNGLPVGFDLDHNSGGLGMKVVKALANQLGGHVSAAPNPGDRGCCFTVVFPDQRFLN
jgi:two-component sensor histidine kinase